MSHVLANRNAVEERLVEVMAHPMCRTFTETTTHFLVLYPAGFCVDGAQASKGAGKLVALNRLLAVMERHWKEGSV